jgi:hypothetical protein
MGIRVYFNEPYKSAFYNRYGVETLKLDNSYWQIMDISEPLETSQDAWEKYYDMIMDDEMQRERVSWIIDNWNRNMIQAVT